MCSDTHFNFYFRRSKKIVFLNLKVQTHILISTFVDRNELIRAKEGSDTHFNFYFRRCGMLEVACLVQTHILISTFVDVTVLDGSVGSSDTHFNFYFRRFFVR